MTIHNITHSVTDPGTGEVKTFTEFYDIISSEGGNVVSTHPWRAALLWAATLEEAQAALKDERITTPDSYSYWLKDIVAFKVETTKRLERVAAEWLRDQAGARKQDVFMARYDAEAMPLLLSAFNVDNPGDSETLDLLREAFDAGISSDDDLTRFVAHLKRLHDEATATRKPKFAGMRKGVRALVTEGKERAREERADEYREAEDKDDFYADNAGDVAQGIVDSLP